MLSLLHACNLATLRASNPFHRKIQSHHRQSMQSFLWTSTQYACLLGSLRTPYAVRYGDPLEKAPYLDTVHRISLLCRLRRSTTAPGSETPTPQFIDAYVPLLQLRLDTQSSTVSVAHQHIEARRYLISMLTLYDPVPIAAFGVIPKPNTHPETSK